MTLEDFYNHVNNAATDEELLVLFSILANRIALATEFISDEDDDIVTDTVLIAIAGDKMLVSDPVELDDPLIRVSWEDYIESND